MKKHRPLQLVALVILIASPAMAAYKVVLKDGTLIEAKAKPALMEGIYRFTGTDGKSRTIPMDQVNQEATKAANDSESASQKPRVITNEDVPSAGASSRAAQPSNAVPSGASTPGKAEPDKSAQGSEQFWRGEAAKIRSQIAAVDAQIARVKEEIAQMGASSVSYSGPQENVYLVKDRESEVRAYEAQKKTLQDQFAELEDRGRKAGASPGWFR